MVSVNDFIAKVEEIAAEEPGYEFGHDGHDGLCDCIGLIIGAIRRAGGQWRGVHGSNYAARQETVRILPIAGTGDLIPGEVVFKAYEPGQGGYNLPNRYERGGEYYNGDMRDYYHVGIVESVYPLRIRHMTTPRVKMDTSIGKWGYHGKLIRIDYSGGGGKEVETVTISGGNIEKPVNMRKEASAKSAIIARIPQGSTADMIQDGGTYSKVRFENLTGYVMNDFIHKSGGGSGGGGDTGETITVNRAELEKVYAAIGQSYTILEKMLGTEGVG